VPNATATARRALARACNVTSNFLDSDGTKLIETTTFVLVPGNPPADRPCEGVAATLEVFDTTGRTSVIVAHPQQN